VHPAYICSDDARWLDFFDWQATMLTTY
jgi:hypothetical protein